VHDLTRVYFGTCLDWAVPADYDGDGVDDFTIFRESTGLWAALSVTRAYYGAVGDVPVTR